MKASQVSGDRCQVSGFIATVTVVPDTRHLTPETRQLILSPVARMAIFPGEVGDRIQILIAGIS